MTEAERRDRARNWLNTIYKDVQDVILDNHVFWQVQEMFEKNQRLADTPSIFNQWMASNFIQAAAIGVRRQTDKDKESVSLHRFLLEIKTFPALISRQSVLDRYLESNTSLPRHVCADMATSGYDRLVGKGRLVPDPSHIQCEIDELLNCALGIRHYVDRRTAHYDVRGLQQPVPTFDDLERCLSLFEKIIKKYKVLLDATWTENLLPTFLYEWKDIFRFPWLEDQV